ncbi:MAG TPA: phage/plasmid primase, P4 family [Clostridia bacterium]|nr:phage/plasmid primase, P4 family [Clostridia bacterium]
MDKANSTELPAGRCPVDTLADILPPEYSEEALALRFTALHSDDLRYVEMWQRWMIYDGSCWKTDHTGRAFEMAREICRSVSADCDDKRIAVRIASEATVRAIEKLARCDRKHAAEVDQWDQNPRLLNTPDGTIDLETGRIRPHDRLDYITKSTAVGPGTSCPLWLKLLNQWTNGNLELERFLQRVVGYALTGLTLEQAFFFLYGTGANGKSVFLSVLATLFGDYASTAPMSTFTAAPREQHPTDIAGLRGARLVTATETEEGRCWAEAKLKALTGGDPVSARFMRQNFFKFQPQFKLVIAGNHKPGLRSVDEAIKRRLHMIPFTVTIPASERDGRLFERLKSEWSGILQWAVEGCLEWHKVGLNPPSVVRDATSEYLESEDSLGRWIGESCLLGSDLSGSSAELYNDWKIWSQRNGEPLMSQKRFAQSLDARQGIKRVRTRNARLFEGICLRKHGITSATHSGDSHVPVC